MSMKLGVLGAFAFAVILIATTSVRADQCTKDCPCGKPPVTCSGNQSCSTDANSCTATSVTTTTSPDGSTETVTTTDKKTCGACPSGGDDGSGGGGGFFCDNFPDLCEAKFAPKPPFLPKGLRSPAVLNDTYIANH